MPEQEVPILRHKIVDPTPLKFEPSQAFVGYSNETNPALTVEQVKIGYRVKLDTSIEQRRYYIGFVQVAYVRVDKKGFHIYLSNGAQATSLMGEHFEKEADMLRYLKQELLGGA